MQYVSVVFTCLADTRETHSNYDTMHLPPVATLTALDPLSTASTYLPCTPPSHNSRNSTPVQNYIEDVLVPSHLTVYQMEDISGHLHRIRIVRLSNGSSLVLKVSPPPATPLLRHECYSLDSEALTLPLLAKSGLPVPRVLRHDARCVHIGSPFLLVTHVSGISYADVSQYLTRSERAGIERQLRSLVGVISQHTSSIYGPYGPVSLVASNQGHKSWREAFMAMLESVLMDGEDMMVSLPYSQIREHLARTKTALDSIKEARLVVLGFGQPENVLIDRRTNEVTGLLDFGRAIWGDCEMGDMEKRNGTKGLLYVQVDISPSWNFSTDVLTGRNRYTCYDSVVTIVTHQYRPRRDSKELDARKTLTTALAQLAEEGT